MEDLEEARDRMGVAALAKVQRWEGPVCRLLRGRMTQEE